MTNIQKKLLNQVSLLASAKDHGIAWVTFITVFTLALNSPTALQSFNQSARNQLAVSQTRVSSFGVGEIQNSKISAPINFHQLIEKQSAKSE
jgi:hypothetical protein